jgi:hypothetical protein
MKLDAGNPGSLGNPGQGVRIRVHGHHEDRNRSGSAYDCSQFRRRHLSRPSVEHGAEKPLRFATRRS